MTKTTSATLALALTALLGLAACGGAADPDAEAAPTPTEAAPTEAPAKPKPPTTTAAPTTTVECSPDGVSRGQYSTRSICVDGEWQDDPQPRPTTTTAAPTTTMPPTTTAPPLPLAPTDYSVALTVTGNQCFDSAGGLVTVEPSFSITGLRGLGAAATIIYEIHGGQHVETFSTDVKADGTMTVRRTVVDTPTCDVVPTAVITQVIER